MASLDPRLQRILIAIVRAYRVEVNDRRRTLSHVRSGGMSEEVDHPGWPEDGPAVGREDLEDLEELGLVRIDRLQRSWTFAPTREAVTAVEQHERELARDDQAVAVNLSWPAVRPVLHALVTLWERHGANPSALITAAAVARELGRPDDDLSVLRAIEALDEDGWLEAKYVNSPDRPLGARPLPKALSGTRGWPGGGHGAAAERLLAALDELIDRESDIDKRGKLSRVREFMIDLGSSTVSELAAKAAGGAL